MTLEWIDVPLEDEGAPAGVVALGLDTTESAEAKARLQSSNDLLHAVIDAAPTAIIGLDLDGKVRTVWNKAAERMLGWRAEEVMGQFLPTVPRDKLAEFERFRDQIRRGQVQMGVDVQRRRRDGSPIDDSIYTAALHDEQGRISGNVAVLVDIGERKRAEREKTDLEGQLRQAQKMEAIGRLAGGVAHDFNNMLGVIIGYAELLREQLRDPLALADLGEIERAAARSREVAGQLLALSRKQPIAPRVLGLNELVGSAQRTLTHLVGEDITVALVRQEDLWRVRADAAQVEQILVNLVVNARDAMPRGGRVTIETANVLFDDAYCRIHLGFSPGQYVSLSVTDDGVGMDKETLAHVFEPFFTTKEPGSGTGLGLAMIYGIVRQNEGFVHVYSEPDRGTVVRVYFPRSTEAEAPEPEVAPATPATGHETVLLVEDEDSVREMVARMLRSIGYAVISTRSAGEALDVCGKSATAIDLLLTDVVMPEMNGRQLAERVASIRPAIRILYMSGYTADVIAHRGFLDPGVHLVQKPFTLRELARKLRETLELRVREKAAGSGQS